MPHGSKIVQLPFAGFYDSIWSSEVDHQEEYEVEGWAERQAEEGVPPELRMPAQDYVELLLRHTDYDAAYRKIAEAYVAAFDSVLTHNHGLKLNLAFESMTSPRFYNFETDRVFAYIGNRAIRRMWKISAADGHHTLREVAAERHTSYDGFHSFYEPGMGDWPRDPRQWDHNQLETLLLAVLRITVGDLRAFEWELFECVTDGDGIYSDWLNAVDWDTVDTAVEEWREDKLAELRATEGEDYSPPYRCQHTPDMFTGRIG